ncbi:MAG: hypothetical protein ACP5G1_02415 [Nanopusillaceae archaeon]
MQRIELIYDKDIIKKIIDSENIEDAIFLIRYNPLLYSIDKSFKIMLLTIIYLLIQLFLQRTYVDIYTNYITVGIIILLIYFLASYYFYAKNYVLLFEKNNLIEIINGNKYKIDLKYIKDIKISKSIFDRIMKTKTMKLYIKYNEKSNLGYILEIKFLDDDNIKKIKDILSKDLS